MKLKFYRVKYFVYIRKEHNFLSKIRKKRETEHHIYKRGKDRKKCYLFIFTVDHEVVENRNHTLINIYNHRKEYICKFFIFRSQILRD